VALEGSGSLRLYRYRRHICLFEYIDGTLRLVHQLCASRRRDRDFLLSHLLDRSCKFAEARICAANNRRSTIIATPTSSIDGPRRFDVIGTERRRCCRCAGSDGLGPFSYNKFSAPVAGDRHCACGLPVVRPCAAVSRPEMYGRAAFSFLRQREGQHRERESCACPGSAARRISMFV